VNYLNEEKFILHLNISFRPDFDPLGNVRQTDDVIGESCQMFCAAEDVTTDPVFEAG